MQLYSTNQLIPHTTFERAVLRGIASDGGLYMPVAIPTLSQRFIKNLPGLSFQEIALEVTTALLQNSISQAALKKIIEKAFPFDAPLVKIANNIYALELFHGPTLSFKDFGARFMAEVMSYYLPRTKKHVTVLVTTSGDTGSAVAAGFLHVPHTKIILLYPKGRISTMQERQLKTWGSNIDVLEINGSFDDCQQLVKQAFLDGEIRGQLLLTSANSINIARLLPQIFYFFAAFGRLENPKLPTIFSVPSGNFGNLTAGVIAKKMGLPIAGFVAATNANNVVPKYLNTGIFAPKKSVHTLSNAMDVGNPNNFPRLQALYGYSVAQMRKDILGVSFSDKQTKQAIQEVYKKYRYIVDPHSAIAYLGLKAYLKGQKKAINGVFLATAHPAKFAGDVEKIVRAKIKIPQSLTLALKKKKKAKVLSNDFEAFKNYLLKTL